MRVVGKRKEKEERREKEEGRRMKK